MTINQPNISHVIRTLQTQLKIETASIHLSQLPGDASNRRYHRASFISPAPNTPQSLIIMQLADPEGFKYSEEISSKQLISTNELPFINIHTHLMASDLPVPCIYYYDRKHGLLYLEDLGDSTLEDAIRQGHANISNELYQNAIDLLASLHTKASQPHKTLDHQCIAFERSFDIPLLMWEFNHFLEYCIIERNQRVMCADDYIPIQEEFQKISTFIASQPKVFTHRDYHSRNIMVKNAKISLIDFQDALMGPLTYDLASILRDAYIELNEDFVEELISRYVQNMPKHLTLNVKKFRRAFDFTSIQRNLKAAGRFIYINSVKKNPKFLTDIPRTLGYVKRNLQKYPELKILHKHLASYVPELS